jgi:hypothetical protein
MTQANVRHSRRANRSEFQCQLISDGQSALATSLARLRRQQGRQQEAAALLAPILGWFTEGFDTADLKESKTLLDELTGPAIAAEGSSCGAAFNSPSVMRCRDPLATSSSSTATVVRVATLVGHMAPLLAPFPPGPAAYLLVDEAPRHRQIAKIARRQPR